MAYRVDLSLDSEAILRGLINFDNKTDFTEKELTFNKIGAVPVVGREFEARDRNSKIQAIFKGRVTGKKTFYYNRIVLDVFLGNEVLRVPWLTCNTTEDLLPYVSQQFGIYLTKDDVLVRYLSPDDVCTEIYIYRPNVSYLGKINVFFEGHPDTLAARVAVRDLSGFTAEQIEY